ncbi:hypothetical protein [Streptomyces cavernae]|uniref:hypothetical protein n=1 Tax=Streptomyces cavernae TaxID=2259034 RepID=UPI000FEB747C|nr:hypothetical protein [Streptomyces cavernae]
MSLVELIAQADERSLAVSGLACLDRCVPLLGGDDEVLRPLWTCLSEGVGWAERLAKVRAELGCAEDDDAARDDDEAVVLARRMLGAAPEDRSAAALRAWADACSVAALQIHRLLDTAADGETDVAARREGRTAGMSPLVAAELRRQVKVLELLATDSGGLRRALDVSVEGRRVLRAVVSRRARLRG